MNPVVYIFMNKSLGMSSGKLAAQAAHAAAVVFNGSTGKQGEYWRAAPHKTILIMEARDDQHLHNISTYLLQRGINSQRVIDEGSNEVDPHSITALATEVLDKDDESLKQTMSTFKLYRDKLRLVMEVDR